MIAHTTPRQTEAVKPDTIRAIADDWLLGYNGCIRSLALRMSQPRVVAILGMHRSGTSCLAGSLQVAGLELGEVFTHNPHNRKGNREHPDIMALHEAVLADNRASWHQPPPGPAAWSPALAMRRREIIVRFSDCPIWGFKDPRTLLTLDGWDEDLPHIEPVGIFRAPQAVAGSLVKRSPAQFDAALAMALWRDYNERLLECWRRRPFPLMEFTDDANRLRDDLVHISQQLDLPGQGRAGDFFEPALQNQRADEPLADEACRELLQRLRAASQASRQ